MHRGLFVGRHLQPAGEPLGHASGGPGPAGIRPSPARVREAYMQAQDSSLLDTPAARWQARAHDLSTEARNEAWA